MNRVDNKIALVTGGGSGIGKTTCELLSQAGAKVVVSDINAESAESTALSIRKAGGDAVAVGHDVSSEEDWQRVMDFAVTTYGELNILVNNAGLALRAGYIDEMSFDNWRRMMSVNLDGVFLGVSQGIKVMKDNEHTSSIINISSASGLLGGEAAAAYSASKAGVRYLTKSAVLDCGRKGYAIRINSICPGGVNAPMSVTLGEKRLKARGKRHPIGRGGETIDIAKGVLFLASDDSDFMTGSDFVIDGGATAGFTSGEYPSEMDWFGEPRA